MHKQVFRNVFIEGVQLISIWQLHGTESSLQPFASVCLPEHAGASCLIPVYMQTLIKLQSAQIVLQEASLALKLWEKTENLLFSGSEVLQKHRS